jgi:hypothetical protein
MSAMQKQASRSAVSLTQVLDVLLAITAGALLISMFLEWFGPSGYSFETAATTIGWDASKPAAVIAALIAAFGIVRLLPGRSPLRRLDRVAGLIVVVGAGLVFAAVERSASGQLHFEAGFDVAVVSALLCITAGLWRQLASEGAGTHFELLPGAIPDALIAAAGLGLVLSTLAGWSELADGFGSLWRSPDVGVYLVAGAGLTLLLISLSSALREQRFPILERMTLALASGVAAYVLSDRIQNEAHYGGTSVYVYVALLGATIAAVGVLWSLRRLTLAELSSEARELRNALRLMDTPSAEPRPVTDSLALVLGVCLTLAMAGGGAAIWAWGGLVVIGGFAIGFAIGRSWLLWAPWAIAIPAGFLIPAISVSQCGSEDDTCGLAWLLLFVAFFAAAAVWVAMKVGIATRYRAATSLRRRSS